MLKVCGILLAAGSSQRFKQQKNKLLHPLANGMPMALIAANNLKAVVDEVCVIVDPDDKDLNGLFNSNPGFYVVENTEAHQGMGASLACGVSACRHADAWIIALADMPFIKPQTILAVKDALSHGSSLVVPVYSGKWGHPVGFGKEYLASLLNLCGDKGGIKILKNNERKIDFIEVNDNGIVLDIDTVEQLDNISFLS